MISLTEDPTTADYHRYAGADHVLSPRRILGEQLAGKAVGTFDPEAIAAVEIDEDFDIAEFFLQSRSELNPRIEIITRANEHENVSKLYRAGADYVLSLAAVSGRMLASIVLDEELLSPGTQLKLIRTTVPGAVGDSLADADIRNRTGCTVVAAERNGSVVANPGASFVIESGDELVVAGTDENISRFQARFV